MTLHSRHCYYPNVIDKGTKAQTDGVHVSRTCDSKINQSIIHLVPHLFYCVGHFCVPHIFI